MPDTLEPVAAADGLTVTRAPAGAVFLVALRPGVKTGEGAFALPFPWPQAPGRWHGEDPGATLIAPNRVLIAGSPAASAGVRATLAELEGQAQARVHEIGAGRSWFSVSGPRAEDLLNCGIAIDLSPEACPVGAVAQTQLSRTNVLLHRQAAGFRLLADASYDAYLDAWFARNVPLIANLARLQAG